MLEVTSLHVNLWPVEHFFHHFGVPLVLVGKEVTSYKIHTLGSLQTYNAIYYGSAKRSKALEQIRKEEVWTLQLLKFVVHYHSENF